MTFHTCFFLLESHIKKKSRILSFPQAHILGYFVRLMQVSVEISGWCRISAGNIKINIKGLSSLMGTAGGSARTLSNIFY